MAKRSSPTGYTGVSERPDGSIRVRVWHEGSWVYERVDVPATPAGYKAAASIRERVNRLSKQGLIVWAEWFPESARAVAPATVPTWSEVADGWLRRKKRSVSPSTHRGYSSWIGMWAEIFGPMAITEIRRSHVLDAIDAMGWTSGKTMSNAMTPLRAVFQEAIVDDLIVKNPVMLIELPKTQRKPADPLSSEEMHLVLDALKESPWFNYFAVAFGTGMRTSELIGLTWLDVNFRAKTVRIHSARTHGVDTGRTKTARERTIELNGLALRAFKDQRWKVKGRGHVFLSPYTGNPIHGDEEPRKAWKRTLASINMRYRRAYETRHTHATLRLASGDDLIAVSRDLGHLKPSMTLDHYAGWIKSQKSDMAKAAFL